MKLWNIVKKVGAGIIREVVPGGGLLVSAVNEFLPEGKKLNNSATGDDLDTAVDSLPPAQRAKLLEKEFDVDITQIKESNETVRTMLQADATMQHTTRPRIALGAFRVVAFTVITTVAVWAVGVVSSDDELVTAVMNGWPFVVGVIGPLVSLLWAYFGILKTEQRDRLNVVSGTSTPSGFAGILSRILQK